MKDRISTKILENGAIRYGIYDEAGNLLRYEYIRPEDEPTEPGSAINKANLLPDAVATALGLTGNPQVKDAFNKLGDLYRHWWRKHSIVYVQKASVPEVKNIVVSSNYNQTETVYYSATITTASNGAISLVSPTAITVSPSNYSAANNLKGRYWSFSPTGGVINYSASNAEVKMWYTEYSVVYYVEISYTSQISAVATPDDYDYTYESNVLESVHPNNGVQGGFWYAYVGKPFNNALSPAIAISGTYTGTGAAGPSGPNALTFPFKPKFVFVYSVNTQLSSGRTELFMFAPGMKKQTLNYSSTNGYTEQVNFALNDRTLSWYVSGSSGAVTATAQLNSAGTTYYYVAVG